MTEVAVPFDFGRRKRKVEAEEPQKRYPARIARTLALAHALQKRVDSGELADYADMARALGFTRARITQIMDLLLLAPEIQEEVLGLTEEPADQVVTEKAFRPMLRHAIWHRQCRVWHALRAALRG